MIKSKEYAIDGIKCKYLEFSILLTMALHNIKLYKLK